MASARWYLSPIALALSIPIGVAVVVLGRLAAYGRAWGVAVVGMFGGAALGFGISTGRHFANVVVRAPFVAAFAIASFTASLLLARWLPVMRASLVAAL